MNDDLGNHRDAHPITPEAVRLQGGAVSTPDGSINANIHARDFLIAEMDTLQRDLRATQKLLDVSRASG